MGGGRIGSQKGLEKLPGMNAQPSGRMKQTGDDAMGLKPAWGPSSETDFTEDDQIPQGLFGLIVGRWDTRDT